MHAHCAVLQRAVHRELAHALLDAALYNLPRPREVSHLNTSASWDSRLPPIPGRRHTREDHICCIGDSLPPSLRGTCDLPRPCDVSGTWTHAAACASQVLAPFMQAFDL